MAKKARVDKERVVEVLEDLAALLELKGENPFKVRAYSTAARTLAATAEPIEELVASGRLGELRGFGEAITKKVTTLVTTGRLPLHEELRASFPEGILELLKVPHLGPRKVKTIYEELGISTLGELEYACYENRLVSLPGFGPKSQKKILEGISDLKRFSTSFLYAAADQAAREVVQALRASQAVEACQVAGSLRRRLETVHDIDLLAASRKPEAVSRAFSSLDQVAEVSLQGPTRTRVRLKGGMGCDLRVVEPGSWASALQHLTGSKEHNTALRGRAKARGLTLNEYGLFRGRQPLDIDSEDALYRALGLELIPPELREGWGEVEAAERGEIPRLVEMGDIRGILHVHTTWSDGLSSIEELVEAARAEGYQYLGICDHSQSAAYAGGLSPERVWQQMRAIEELQSRYRGFRIFKGIEVDILPDGSLDYEDDLLFSLDFVVASIHSRFGLSREAQTERLLRAIRHPAVTIIGHPTGRLLLARKGYDVDLEAVLEACAVEGVAVELNAHPQRLDLDWRYCRRAKELGVLVAINPDAHHVGGLEDVEYGVGIARKGWLEASDVLNCMDAQALEAFFRSRKG